MHSPLTMRRLTRPSRSTTQNVKKVESFSRSLISVRDLVDQYGGVWFDSDGVHVVSFDKGDGQPFVARGAMEGR